MGGWSEALKKTHGRKMGKSKISQKNNKREEREIGGDVDGASVK